MYEVSACGRSIQRSVISVSANQTSRSNECLSTTKTDAMTMDRLME